MKLTVRGMSIELAPDDARVPIIEALLFGRSLPPPLPAPKLPDPPPLEPLVEVPAGMRRFWEALKQGDRRELAVLSVRAYPAVELEQVLGVSQRVLMGQHSRIGRLASRFRVPARVRPSGRNRKGRKYRLDTQSAAWVRALASEPPPPLF